MTNDLQVVDLDPGEGEKRKKMFLEMSIFILRMLNNDAVLPQYSMYYMSGFYCLGRNPKICDRYAGSYLTVLLCTMRAI
jgi:hypothetical protein